MTTQRKALFVSIMVILTIGLAAVVGEVFLLVFNPQVSYFPRWDSSREYGLVLPKNKTIVHKRPGKWEYRYTINEYGCRGKAVPMATSYDKMNIVVLGDSYAMGTAVNDSEEFAAVIARELGGRANVINTGVGGWGLTQEIRRFYEFGRLYNPAVVILQFCANDPGEDLAYRVTTMENGTFMFHDVPYSRNVVTNFLSKSSVVQHSQLYIFFRNMHWRAGQKKPRTGNAHMEAPVPSQVQVPSDAERFYNELIDGFAADLHARGIRFIMIAVQGQLNLYPSIREKVTELESRGLLQYVEIEAWLRNETDVTAPEGHWNKRAHAIIGRNLARIIQE